MKVDVCGILFDVQEIESNCRTDGSRGSLILLRR